MWCVISGLHFWFLGGKSDGSCNSLPAKTGRLSSLFYIFFGIFFLFFFFCIFDVRIETRGNSKHFRIVYEKIRGGLGSTRHDR